MNTLTYIISALIAFLGLIFGIITAYIAKEELRDGKKYFIFLQNLFVALILTFLAYFYNLHLYFTALIFLITFLALYLIEDIRKSYFIYPLLALPFYLSLKNNTSFIIESLLIFLYGFPTAALFVQKKRKILQIILNHSPFIAVALLLLFA